MDEPNAEKLFPVSIRWTNKLARGLEKLLGRFTGDEPKIARQTGFLIARYSEKHRVYHNLNHIKNLLQTAAIFKNRYEDYDCVQLAVWYHDAIYDPQSKTNETESAALACESLTEINVPRASVEKVEKMILATQRHEAAGLDRDGKFFLDLDLAILSAGRTLYRKYAAAIRAEYSFVPEPLYRRERRRILESFLQREFVYYTADIRKIAEEHARRNIANEIKELS